MDWVPPWFGGNERDERGTFCDIGRSMSFEKVKNFGLFITRCGFQEIEVPQGCIGFGGSGGFGSLQLGQTRWLLRFGGLLYARSGFL